MGIINTVEYGVKNILITEDEIKDKVREMGQKLSDEYRDKNLLLISILKGAFVFMADIMREISIPCKIDFMCVSSYKSSTESNGKVEILKDLGIDISDFHVLVIEDILDTGNTLNAVMKILSERNPLSLKICTLLDKPSRRTSQLKADYICFTIPDEFVIGYGLDCAENYRNLKYIGTFDTDLCK